MHFSTIFRASSSESVTTVQFIFNMLSSGILIGTTHKRTSRQFLELFHPYFTVWLFLLVMACFSDLFGEEGVMPHNNAPQE